MAQVQTAVFSRTSSPDAFHVTAVQPLKNDVNAFLSTLVFTNVLDVRYDYGQLQTTPALVYAVATVIYLV